MRKKANAISRILAPVAGAAAASVVGPLGLVVAPAITMACVWAGEALGGHSAAAAGAAEVLKHIFGHLSGDAAKEVFSSLVGHGNHDLRVAMAEALRDALDKSQEHFHSDRILVENADGQITEWFALWNGRLERGLDTREDAALLFYSDDPVDPVRLASTDRTKWWSEFGPVLVRWGIEQHTFEHGKAIREPVLPQELGDYLEANLLNMTETAFLLVLRNVEHQRGFVAWQQSFLTAIAKTTANTDAKVADEFRSLATRVREFHEFARAEFAEVHSHLDRLEGLLTARIDRTAPLGQMAGKDIEGRLLRITEDLAILSGRARKLSPRVGSILEIPSLLTADILPRRRAVGETVQWGRLLDGLYAPRPALLADLLNTFLEWTRTIQPTLLARRLPVFWIAGRSGDGKSVLLLQLAAALLGDRVGGALYQAAWPDSLPEVIYHIQDTVDGDGLIFVVVEDLHRISEQDAFLAAMRVILDNASLRVAILACGPSPEESQFLRSNPFVEAHSWTIPRLTASDLDTFSEWFGTPIAPPQSWDRLILVEALFMANVGSPIPAFAEHFGKRLATFGVFEKVRSMAALNAMDVAAPISLCTDAERESIERLAMSDQLHFELQEDASGAGIRLVHGQIAWRLFEEWSTDALRGTSIIRSLARTLASAFKVPSFGALRATTVLLAVSHKLPTLLNSDPETVRVVNARFFEALIQFSAVHPFARSSAVRGALGYFLTNRFSSADDFSSAILASADVVNDRDAPSESRAAVAAQLAVLAKQGRIPTRTYKEDAESLILSTEVGPFAQDAVGMLVNRGVSSTQLCESWLEYVPGAILPVRFLSAALKQSGASNALRAAARAWCEANWDSNRLSEVLTVLVNVAKDDETEALALDWLESHRDTRSASNVIAVLIRVSAHEPQICSLAESWLAEHDHWAGSLDVLCALLKKPRPDDRLRFLGLDLLSVHGGSNKATNLISSMLNAFRGNPDVIRDALEWVHTHWEALSCATVIGSLLNAAGGAKSVRALAMGWITAHPLEPATSHLLSTVLKGGAAELELRAAGLNWIESNLDNPTAFNPLATLLTWAGDDERVRNVAIAWIHANAERSGASQLLSALLKATPDDLQVISLARSWISGHLLDTGASHLLSTVIRVGADDDHLMQIATNWVRSNMKSVAASQLLAALVANPATRKESVALAWKWVDDNDHRPFEQHQLIAAMIRAAPLETLAVDKAIDLLKASTSARRPSYLYVVLAAVAPCHRGVGELLSRYLANPEIVDGSRDVVLDEWLAADKTSFTAVHAIIRLYRERDQTSSEGRQLFGILARSCARKYQIVFDAISSDVLDSRELCYLIGRGIPSVQEIDIVSLIGINLLWPLGSEGYIWNGILCSDVSSDVIVEPLNEWLAANWRHPGYGEVLSGIRVRSRVDPAFISKVTWRVRADLASSTRDPAILPAKRATRNRGKVRGEPR